MMAMLLQIILWVTLTPMAVILLFLGGVGFYLSIVPRKWKSTEYRTSMYLSVLILFAAGLILSIPILTTFGRQQWTFFIIAPALLALAIGLLTGAYQYLQYAITKLTRSKFGLRWRIQSSIRNGKASSLLSTIPDSVDISFLLPVLVAMLHDIRLHEEIACAMNHIHRLQCTKKGSSSNHVALPLEVAAALCHENPSIREGAIKLLSVWGANKANRLGPLLDDPSARVRKAACEAMAYCSGNLVPFASRLMELALQADTVDSPAGRALIRIGKELTPFLLPALQEASPAEQERMVWIIIKAECYLDLEAIANAAKTSGNLELVNCLAPILAGCRRRIDTARQQAEKREREETNESGGLSRLDRLYGRDSPLDI